MKQFSFDRHNNVMEFNFKKRGATQEEKNWYEALRETRGVYSTKKKAEKAILLNKPIFANTDTKGGGYYI